MRFVVNKVNAINTGTQINQPNYISIADKDSILSKNLPDSVDTKKRKELEIEFKKYMKLKNDIMKETDKNKREASFIQIRNYEKIFEKEKYEPYLDFVANKKTSNLNRGNILNENFIQTKSKEEEKKRIRNYQ